ncbi:GNAT family N-acetyltransferase [Liquorilactobacillus capillatus]|uniref:Acetyltransferase n=1 Tax=Liquorilactobacillus capillatus DSM 19910 TaxID=1423731 RepID=A0A0R1M9H9_9LACO|nr:acetyltransferase [Liquorilactobacillus capillatus DSM 19910]
MSKMKDLQINFRQAQEKDITQMLAIYAPYVEETAITFEYKVPTIDEFTRRVNEISTRYPYLIAEQQNTLLGYAYLSPFHPRAAYAWSAEISIYLKTNCRHHGLGRRFYTLLEKIAKQQNIMNLNACIGVPQKQDPYLPLDSIKFHEHMDFIKVGHFHNCGYKFATWYDMIWMEKQLGTHFTNVKPVIPFPKLSNKTLDIL